MVQEWSKKWYRNGTAQGWYRNAEGMLKECCRNGIGMRMDGGTGMEREWCRNGMGMAQEWNGAGTFLYADFKRIH